MPLPASAWPGYIDATLEGVGIYVAVWDGALKNYGPNLGFDYGGRLVAAWLDR